jgi:hypothetical protein
MVPPGSKLVRLSGHHNAPKSPHFSDACMTQMGVLPPSLLMVLALTQVQHKIHFDAFQIVFKSISSYSVSRERG